MIARLRTRAAWLPSVLTLWAALACSGEPAPPEAATDPVADSAPVAPAIVRSFERDVVFLTTARDTTLLVPWLLEATSRPDGVDRTARAWLLRGGDWEPFLDQHWSTPPTRVPWRILPVGPLHLVVGPDEALERLIFDAAPRELEVALDEPLVEWTGRQGEVFRILEGGLLLGGRRSSGVVLDLSRGGESDRPPPGDWALLVSGDSLQLVLHATPEDGENLYEGWARLDFRELSFPQLEVAWADVRAFERARRDVPVAWTLQEESPSVQGRLDVVTAHLETGEGEGPLLPVDALFEVSGSLTLEGSDYPVRGLFRHTQR